MTSRRVDIPRNSFIVQELRDKGHIRIVVNGSPKPRRIGELIAVIQGVIDRGVPCVFELDFRRANIYSNSGSYISAFRRLGKNSSLSDPSQCKIIIRVTNWLTKQLLKMIPASVKYEIVTLDSDAEVERAVDQFLEKKRELLVSETQRVTMENESKAVKQTKPVPVKVMVKTTKVPDASVAKPRAVEKVVEEASTEKVAEETVEDVVEEDVAVEKVVEEAVEEVVKNIEETVEEAVEVDEDIVEEVVEDGYNVFGAIGKVVEEDSIEIEDIVWGDDPITGGDGYVIGHHAGMQITDTGANTVIGGASALTTGNDGVLIGYNTKLHDGVEDNEVEPVIDVASVEGEEEKGEATKSTNGGGGVVEKSSGDVEEPSGGVEEPSGDVEEPSEDDEPSGDEDEPSEERDLDAEVDVCLKKSTIDGRLIQNLETQLNVLKEVIHGDEKTKLPSHDPTINSRVKTVVCDRPAPRAAAPSPSQELIQDDMKHPKHPKQQHKKTRVAVSAVKPRLSSKPKPKTTPKPKTSVKKKPKLQMGCISPTSRMTDKQYEQFIVVKSGLKSNKSVSKKPTSTSIYENIQVQSQKASPIFKELGGSKRFRDFQMAKSSALLTSDNAINNIALLCFKAVGKERLQWIKLHKRMLTNQSNFLVRMKRRIYQ